MLSENESVYHNEKCINFLSHVWLTMLPGAFRTWNKIILPYILYNTCDILLKDKVLDKVRTKNLCRHNISRRSTVWKWVLSFWYMYVNKCTHVFRYPCAKQISIEPKLYREMFLDLFLSLFIVKGSILMIRN